LTFCWLEATVRKRLLVGSARVWTGASDKSSFPVVKPELTIKLSVTRDFYINTSPLANDESRNASSRDRSNTINCSLLTASCTHFRFTVWAEHRHSFCLLQTCTSLVRVPSKVQFQCFSCI